MGRTYHTQQGSTTHPTSPNIIYIIPNDNMANDTISYKQLESILTRTLNKLAQQDEQKTQKKPKTTKSKKK